MKRCFIPILLILTLSSGTMASCSQNYQPTTTLTEDKPSWNEKQVIDYLYTYLADKFEKINDMNSRAEKKIMEWNFQTVVLNVDYKYLQETLKQNDLLGESIEMKFGESPSGIPVIMIHANALKYLANYSGNGWWSVTIGDKEWRVNEVRNEVVAWNQGAKALLEKATPRTYYNSVYGYYFEYAPSWVVDDEDKTKVMITDSLQDTIAFVYVFVVDKKTLDSFGGWRGYVDARLTYFKNEYYSFEKTNVSYLTIDYKYQTKENSPTNEGRLHTFLSGDMLFEIVCSGRIIEGTNIMGQSYSYSNIYDPFESFRFQP